MAERPQQSFSNDRASALAERFGMTREAVEELLQHTHSEYANVALPPMEPKLEPSIERAAETFTAKPEGPTVPPVHKPTQPLSGGFIVAIFVVLLIGLGIALSFRQGCFQRRGERLASKPVDTIQSMMNHAAAQASTPPQPVTNVPPGEVPPESLVVPQEEAPGVTGAPTHSGITTEVQALKAAEIPIPKPILVTSSNFDAEETLAKLHAEGFVHAYMRAIRTRKGVSYRVFSRR